MNIRTPLRFFDVLQLLRDRHCIRRVATALLLSVGFLACGSEPSAAELSANAEEVAAEQAKPDLSCPNLTLVNDSSETLPNPFVDFGDWMVTLKGCGQVAIEGCRAQESYDVQCSSMLVGSLDIGGTAFVPISCVSGSVEGQHYFGVDLDDGTNTLRLVQAGDGTQTVVILNDAGGTPISIPGCSRFQLSANPAPDDDDCNSSCATGVETVSGSATLSCGAAMSAISAAITFNGC